MIRRSFLAAIFAVTNAYTDMIPDTDVKRYEVELIQFLKQKYSTILKTIEEKKQVSDDVKKDLVAALKEFGAIFKPSSK